MVSEIGEILKSIISGASLAYVDKLAGVVRIETVKKQASKTELVEKSFPIYCPGLEPCPPNNIINLIPDKKIKSLFYFEDNGGVFRNDRTYGFNNYTANLRLVVWLNPKMLGSNDCSITSPIMQQLVKLFNKKRFNVSPISKIKIRFNRELYRDVSVFAKYKYNRQSDLLEYPYDFFALDFFVDFSIHDNCIDEFTPDMPVC